MKKLSLFLSICMISGIVSAQKNFVLKGRVLDAGGSPVHNVRVSDNVTADSTQTDQYGIFQLFSSKAIASVLFEKEGFNSVLKQVNEATFLEVMLTRSIDILELEKPIDLIEGDGIDKMTVISQMSPSENGAVKSESYKWTSQPESHYRMKALGYSGYINANDATYVAQNSESYSATTENSFRMVSTEPLSTFSIDVDRASYSNVRRFINQGQLPPADAVRVEEMINYFDYDYKSPSGSNPIAIFTEATESPFNEGNYILHVGLKARDLEKNSLPPSNLVFLIDVSGSMNQSNKLPLLKSSMKMLVEQLREEDRVAIVVYAGAAGLVLESTSGAKKKEINAAIDRLSAGGSTAGGAGIQLAYDVAFRQFLKEGNNRIILATDGDFNVGVSSNQEMEKLIETKRNNGVFLTVLGFGMGNYKDSKMEILADKGNGNYAYIDNITEAKKTLVEEFGSTMYTVAKDVKVQVEFNPANVAEYRLIGYENRLLNKEDFNDDKKDAGEMGAGHVVTVLYEIVPVGSSSRKVDPLKYVVKDNQVSKGVLTNELATLKVRYKDPESSSSELLTHVIRNTNTSFEAASENVKWSSAIAGFGMLLRESMYCEMSSYTSVIKTAEGAIGKDPEGHKREAIQLMKSAELLSKSTAQR